MSFPLNLRLDLSPGETMVLPISRQRSGSPLLRLRDKVSPLEIQRLKPQLYFPHTHQETNALSSIPDITPVDDEVFIVDTLFNRESPTADSTQLTGLTRAANGNIGHPTSAEAQDLCLASYSSLNSNVTQAVVKVAQPVQAKTEATTDVPERPANFKSKAMSTQSRGSSDKTQQVVPGRGGRVPVASLWDYASNYFSLPKAQILNETLPYRHQNHYLGVEVGHPCSFSGKEAEHALDKEVDDVEVEEDVIMIDPVKLVQSASDSTYVKHAVSCLEQKEGTRGPCHQHQDNGDTLVKDAIISENDEILSLVASYEQELAAAENAVQRKHAFLQDASSVDLSQEQALLDEAEADRKAELEYLEWITKKIKEQDDKQRDYERTQNQKGQPQCHQCDATEAVEELFPCQYTVSLPPVVAGAALESADLKEEKGISNAPSLTNQCHRVYCESCLTKIYSSKPGLKGSGRWKCPHCKSGCYCWSCVRQTNLARLRHRWLGEATVKSNNGAANVHSLRPRGKKGLTSRGGSRKRARSDTGRHHGYNSVCGVCLDRVLPSPAELVENYASRAGNLVPDNQSCLRSVDTADRIPNDHKAQHHITQEPTSKSQTYAMNLSSEKLISECSRCGTIAHSSCLSHMFETLQTGPKRVQFAFLSASLTSTSPHLFDCTAQNRSSGSNGWFCPACMEENSQSTGVLLHRNEGEGESVEITTTHCSATTDKVCYLCRSNCGSALSIYFKEPMELVCGMSENGASTFVHGFCLLWFYRAHSRSVESLKTVGSRRLHPCAVCAKDEGFLLRCQQEGCPECFHPLCGHIAGYRVNYVISDRQRGDTAHDMTSQSADIVQAYCGNHTSIKNNVHSFLALRDLRHKMEKARLLLEMIYKREKAKKRLMQTELELLHLEEENELDTVNMNLQESSKNDPGNMRQPDIAPNNYHRTAAEKIQNCTKKNKKRGRNAKSEPAIHINQDHLSAPHALSTSDQVSGSEKSSARRRNSTAADVSTTHRQDPLDFKAKISPTGLSYPVNPRHKDNPLSPRSPCSAQSSEPGAAKRLRRPSRRSLEAIVDNEVARLSSPRSFSNNKRSPHSATGGQSVKFAETKFSSQEQKPDAGDGTAVIVYCDQNEILTLDKLKRQKQQKFPAHDKQEDDKPRLTSTSKRRKRPEVSDETTASGTRAHTSNEELSVREKAKRRRCQNSAASNLNKTQRRSIKTSAPSSSSSMSHKPSSSPKLSRQRRKGAALPKPALPGRRQVSEKRAQSSKRKGYTVPGDQSGRSSRAGKSRTCGTVDDDTLRKLAEAPTEDERDTVSEDGAQTESASDTDTEPEEMATELHLLRLRCFKLPSSSSQQVNGSKHSLTEEYSHGDSNIIPSGPDAAPAF